MLEPSSRWVCTAKRAPCLSKPTDFVSLLTITLSYEQYQFRRMLLSCENDRRGCRMPHKVNTSMYWSSSNKSEISPNMGPSVFQSGLVLLKIMHVSWGKEGISVSGDAQSWTEQIPEQPDLIRPVLGRCSDMMTSRGLFQPKLFCNYVIMWLISFLFLTLVTVLCSHLSVFHPAPVTG